MGFIGFVLVGSAVALASPAGQNATKKAAKAISDTVYYTGKKIADAIPKPKPSKVVKAVAKAGKQMIGQIATVAKGLDKTILGRPKAPSLKLPQPCPDGFGWDQLPKDLLPKIYGVIKGEEWVREFLNKLERIKKRPTEQEHHIVPKNAWDECGTVKRDFYLTTAREVLKKNIAGGVNNQKNFVSIVNSLHRHIHTRIYFDSLHLTFNRSLIEGTEKDKKSVIMHLNTYREILTALSDLVKKYF